MGLVRDIMIRSVITIEHDKTAKDVALLFAEKGISSTCRSKGRKANWACNRKRSCS